MIMYRFAMKNNYAVYGNGNGNTEVEHLHVNTGFPYRRYELESKVKYLLEKILNSTFNIHTEKWSLPPNKVYHRLQPTLFYLTDTVVYPTLELIDNHWEFDQIIDYYNETARIKTPGYGEKYSTWEYWYNERLHKRWRYDNVNDRHQLRELLYSNITEARPAYSTVCISLYKALSNMLSYSRKFDILDIAAYGERAIAAANLGYNYDGVDPNYDLITGHNKLLIDLRCLRPDVNIQFYHMGLEEYKSCKLYDIITYSIPPFNTEPYAKDSEYNTEQSYAKYFTFEEYLHCFLTGIIYKAYKLCKKDGIFSITALDRMPKYYPIKIPYSYASKHLELVYVEIMLLIIASFGFKYVGAIGLSVGNKKPSVPWWTFMKQSNEFSYQCIQLMKQHYPESYTKIGSRCLSILDNEALFDNVNREVIVDNNVLKISRTEFIHLPSIKLELIRYQIQNYVIGTIQCITKLNSNKIRTILGRYLMLRSISATYDEPWKSCLFVDPLFPTFSKHTFEDIREIEEQVITYFEDRDMGKNIVQSNEYWFNSYNCLGITELYHTIVHYMYTIPLSSIFVEIENTKDSYIIRTNGLHSIPGYTSDLFMFSHVQDNDKNIDLLAIIRYETLGAKGHQYTRPIERTKLIEQILNEKIIDIYASIFNNNSLYYCSLYPDVEKHSYGSAFSIKMIQGAYLANPVDIPFFIKKSVHNILQDLNEAHSTNKSLSISMSFTLWLDTNTSFIDNFNIVSHKTLLQNTDNIGLNMLSTSKYLRILYILDKKRFPSTLLNETSMQRNTISVGVILTSLPDLLQTKHIEQLAGKHYVIIKE